MQTLLIVAALLLLAGGLALALLNPHATSSKPANDAAPPELPVAQARAKLTHASALALTRTLVWTSTRPQLLAQRCLAEAERAHRANDTAEALRWLDAVRELGLHSPQAIALHATLLLDAKDFAAARALLKHSRFEHPELGQLYDRSFDEDPVFLPSVATLSTRQLSSIRALGGGSTITLRLKTSQGTSLAFKPNQTRRQSNYRSEIASWRLCELLGCHFAIPYNRPVRLVKGEFNLLYGSGTDQTQLKYAENFVDLSFTLEGGIWYLYGTEKEWVSNFAQFPIENESIWSAWLQQATPLSAFDQDLESALRPLQRERRTAKAFEKIIANKELLDTRGLAAQISDVLLFDYLVGNWDRFSTVPEWWGTNCQFANGRIVSIDNGAAFPNYANKKVKSKFEMVERFSADLVRELRALDKQSTLARLFPSATAREREMFEQFWTQRAAALARIDALVAEHGEQAVLVF